MVFFFIRVIAFDITIDFKLYLAELLCLKRLDLIPFTIFFNNLFILKLRNYQLLHLRSLRNDLFTGSKSLNTVLEVNQPSRHLIFVLFEDNTYQLCINFPSSSELFIQLLELVVTKCSFVDLLLQQ